VQISRIGRDWCVTCLPAKAGWESTAPTKKDMHDPCKSVLSVALYLFVAFCVFLWLTHFAAGKYIFGHQKSLEEAYFRAKSISSCTKSFSALVFFTF